VKAEDKILISSSTKNLKSVRDFIEQKATQYGLEQSIVNQVVMSVDEACTNIIKYTHKYDDSESIEILLKKENKILKITITYRGNEFDPNTIEVPDMKTYLKQHKVGGLGIPLIKMFMNKIELKHYQPDLNELTLIKYT